MSPHCDSNVLHAPGTCRYCDDCQDQQQERIKKGINFTGENDPSKKPCPSTLRRKVEDINKWGGNIARPSGPWIVERWCIDNKWRDSDRVKMSYEEAMGALKSLVELETYLQANMQGPKPKEGVWRMRNTETSDIIMGDIL